MLTVVMTTRDRSDVLASTLSAWSRVASPAGGCRRVVVDDGSLDDTPARLASLGPAGGWVARRVPRRGQNAARNVALGDVQGSLVVFADDDAHPAPDFLVRMRAAADQVPDADVVAGTVRPRFEAAPSDAVLRAVRHGPAFAALEREASGWIDPTEALGPAFAVRASRFAAGLRFDPTVGPDGSGDYPMGAETELLLRLERDGARAWYATDAVVEHLVTAAQTTPSALVHRAFRYGRGRWRLRTARLASARLRVRGVPLALVADLVSRRLAWGRARRRGDEARALRAAWRIAVLAGQWAQIRTERGLGGGLGWGRRLLPKTLRAELP